MMKDRDTRGFEGATFAQWSKMRNFSANFGDFEYVKKGGKCKRPGSIISKFVNFNLRNLIGQDSFRTLLGGTQVPYDKHFGWNRD